MNDLVEYVLFGASFVYFLLYMAKEKREKKILETRVSNLETALQERRLIDQLFCKMLPKQEVLPEQEILERKKPGWPKGKKRKTPAEGAGEL